MPMTRWYRSLERRVCDWFNRQLLHPLVHRFRRDPHGTHPGAIVSLRPPHHICVSGGWGFDPLRKVTSRLRDIRRAVLAEYGWHFEFHPEFLPYYPPGLAVGDLQEIDREVAARAWEDFERLHAWAAHVASEHVRTWPREAPIDVMLALGFALHNQQGAWVLVSPTKENGLTKPTCFAAYLLVRTASLGRARRRRGRLSQADQMAILDASQIAMRTQGGD